MLSYLAVCVCDLHVSVYESFSVNFFSTKVCVCLWNAHPNATGAGKMTAELLCHGLAGLFGI